MSLFRSRRPVYGFKITYADNSSFKGAPRLFWNKNELKILPRNENLIMCMSGFHFSSCLKSALDNSALFPFAPYWKLHIVKIPPNVQHRYHLISDKIVSRRLISIASIKIANPFDRYMDLGNCNPRTIQKWIRKLLEEARLTHPNLQIHGREIYRTVREEGR